MSVLYVIRHADAGEPWEWPKDDNDRPLSKFGIEQVREVANSVRTFGIKKIYTSYAKRCEETSNHIKRLLRGVEIESSALLGQGRGQVITSFVRSLPHEPAIVCTHSDNIYALLQAIHTDDHLDIPKRLTVPSGSFWVLTRAGALVTELTYVGPGQKPPSPSEVEPEEVDVWIE